MLPVLMTYKMIKPFPYDPCIYSSMFTHIWLIFKLHVGNYTSPMHPMGLYASNKKTEATYIIGPTNPKASLP